MSGTERSAGERASSNGLARVTIDRPAGQLAAAMDANGDWVVRLRRHDGEPWRLVCTGDLQSLTAAADLPRYPTEQVRVGPLEINPAARIARVAGQEVKLAKKEFDALIVLASEPARVFPREHLYEVIWGREPENIRTAGVYLSTTLSRLRAKLAAAGAARMVINHQAVGYSLLRGDSGAADL